MLSRKHVPREQISLLLEHGIIPVSIDFRLCPEVDIVNGPLSDARDAVQWARNELPHLLLKPRGLSLDGDHVGAIGWSSGGTIALLLGQTLIDQAYRPPDAIVSFYCPTDFEDDCKHFNQVLSSPNSY